jgi:benzoyl-CoA reductase/2-hydroxyglutaryl-CoA dehydratase subunit BcrC/BadD/HgdB
MFMAPDYRKMWKELGLNLEKHDALLGVLTTAYPQLYLEQKNRPQGMDYFDFVISEIHGLRIKELQEHKNNGGKVFGTFCLYVPDEIINALNGISVGLCAGTDFSIPDAETVLPRNLCPLIKSFYGFKAGKVCPYMEISDVVIGETTCDGKTKCYEVLAEVHPVYVMEIPHRKNAETFKLWRHELNRFVAGAERLTGNRLTAANLKEAIKMQNAKRVALQRLNALRWNKPTPISGKDALLINQIAFYDDPVRFTGSVNKLVQELESRVAAHQGVFPKNAVALMTSGTPFAIPNWKLHHVAETSGYPIVAEESCVGSRYFSNLVEDKADTLDGLLDAIANRYFGIHCACFTPNDERMDDIVELYKKSGAKGVINNTLNFCTPYLVESHKVKERLDAEKIPMLNIESDYSMGDMEQLRTRIQAFVESF